MAILVQGTTPSNVFLNALVNYKGFHWENDEVGYSGPVKIYHYLEGDGWTPKVVSTQSEHSAARCLLAQQDAQLANRSDPARRLQ